MERLALNDLVEQVVRAVLERHPEATLAALSPDGWFVPMPDSFPTGNHRVLPPGNSLDVIVEADRIAVINAWMRSRTDGTAQAVVRFLEDPESPMVLHFGDLRERHGIFISIGVPNGIIDATMLAVDAPLVKARFCRMRRNDMAGVIEAEESVSRMLGWTSEELVTKKSIELVHPDDYDRAVENWMSMMASPGKSVRWRGRYRNVDDTWTWVEVSNLNRLEDPDHGDVLTEMVNIEEEMAMLEALRAREELFRELNDALPVGVFHVDLHGAIVFSNPRLLEVTGLIGVRNIGQLAELVADDDRAAFDAASARVVTGESADVEVRIVDGNGTTRVCQVNLRPLRSAAGVVDGAIGCVSDITAAAQVREELRARAELDGLTGCHNRASTVDHLRHLLTSMDVGVVFIDLDSFKPINDTYGHSVGDTVLTMAANRLRSCVRREDVVGRLGGDEFVVLYPGLSDPDQLMTLARRLEERFSGEVVVGGHRLAMRASFGAALGRSGGSADQVLAEADAAMYEVKRGSQRRTEALEALDAVTLSAETFE